MRRATAPTSARRTRPWRRSGRSCEGVDLTTDAFLDALLEDDVEDLYENAPCGYVSTTPDGTIVKVNGTLLGWMGLAREELVGRRRFVDLLSPGGRIYYETHLDPMLRMQGRAREIAVDLVCAGGQRLPALVNAVLKRDDTGEAQVVRVAVFDATERRSYERELLGARRAAEESEARARALARTLQATFIPPEPPQVPGLDVAARYRPAGDGDEVGGDFYDVFETGEGDWAVVLGDVCGKGVEAATVTALARYTARAAAVHARSPAHVLRTLNEALLRQGVDRFCTVLYIRVIVGDGEPRLTVCSGGHLPPLLVHSHGRAEPIGPPGTLLGVFETVELPEAQLALAPGEALIAFTDGVTEARGRHGQFYGEDRLASTAVAAAAGSAGEIADSLLDDVLAFQAGSPRDDVAVVVLKLPAK